jgi:hypothetical protein
MQPVNVFNIITYCRYLDNTPVYMSSSERPSAEYADHVVLHRLDGLLGKVAAMVLGGDGFVCHLGEFNFGFVCKQCLVVKYLVPWDDAALGHLRTSATAGKNEFAFTVILECLALGGDGVYVVEDHDVVVAKAGDKREMPCLVLVQCVLQIDDLDEDVVCDNVCSWWGLLTSAIMLGGFALLVATGASMGQVDWTPWCCPLK